MFIDSTNGIHLFAIELIECHLKNNNRSRMKICFNLHSREFKEDSSRKEFVFPLTNFTQHERTCLKQAALDMGLRVELKEVQWIVLTFSWPQWSLIAPAGIP